MIRISSVPRPQLAPIKRTPIAAISVIAWAGLTPIMVRRLVSKLKVATIGMPGATSCAAATAAATSPRSLIVSIKMASQPPATRPFICSAKSSLPDSGVKVPIGSINSPDGPTSPNTKTFSNLSATARATSEPALLSS